MAVRYTYEEYDSRPAAPVIEVAFSRPVETPQRKEVRCKALIDSGADLTCIPPRAVDKLELKCAGTIRVTGAAGEAERFLYIVRVRIEGVGDFTVRAAGIERDRALLGRDIINRWRLLLDGPNKASEIL